LEEQGAEQTVISSLDRNSRASLSSHYRAAGVAIWLTSDAGHNTWGSGVLSSRAFSSQQSSWTTTHIHKVLDAETSFNCQAAMQHPVAAPSSSQPSILGLCIDALIDQALEDEVSMIRKELVDEYGDQLLGEVEETVALLEEGISNVVGLPRRRA